MAVLLAQDGYTLSNVVNLTSYRTVVQVTNDVQYQTLTIILGQRTRREKESR